MINLKNREPVYMYIFFDKYKFICCFDNLYKAIVLFQDIKNDEYDINEGSIDSVELWVGSNLFISWSR